MIKAVLLGLWVCAVALGASYGMMVLTKPETKVEQKASYFGGLDYVKTELTGIPVIRSGSVQGYVLAQFVFTAEQKTLQSLSVKPELFLVDAAFRKLYADEDVDYRKLKKQNIDELTNSLKTEVNRRYGKPVVRDILVERLDYMPIDAVRNGRAGRLAGIKLH